MLVTSSCVVWMVLWTSRPYFSVGFSVVSNNADWLLATIDAALGVLVIGADVEVLAGAIIGVIPSILLVCISTAAPTGSP